MCVPELTTPLGNDLKSNPKVKTKIKKQKVLGSRTCKKSASSKNKSKVKIQ